MSIRDFLFGPNATMGSAEAPERRQLGAVRQEAIPTSFGAGEFSQAVERLLQREGGYSNNPADRGGATNYGISSGAYPNLDVSKLTREQAVQLYKQDYWDAINADQLDPRVREIAFDTAVNHGVGTAKQLLAETGNDPEALIAARKQIYENLIAKDPSQEQFRKGWMNRLEGLKQISSYEERGSGFRPLQRPEGGGERQRSAAWQLIMSPLPEAAPDGGDTKLSDFGRALAVTAGDFAKAPVAALENLAGQVSRSEGDAAIYGAAAQGILADARRSISEWQKGFFDSMSPEAIDRAQRELLTLDPEKTIWQGGVREFMSSLALKGTLSLGPTIGPMITTALLSRMGVGAAASTLYGAQEGLVSAGLSAAQIADDIEQTPIEELRKVERFKALEAQLGEAEARRQYTNEVQGIVPAATGVLVGSIAKIVGKPLDKIFGTAKGLPLLQRIRAGAVTEALQEGPQSFVEQVAQNYATMAYNSDVNLLDGTAEQVIQGMLLGGVMGGTFAAAFGNRPRNNPMTSDPVGADVRAAIGEGPAAPTSSSTPATPPAGPSSAGPAEGVPTTPEAEIPDTSGIELVPEPPPLADRFAVSPAQSGQGGIPFDPTAIATLPELLPPDTIDYPQPEAKTKRGKKKKLKAPKGAIPLTLAEDEQIPDVQPDLSPLEAAAATPPGEIPWDPNAPAAPEPELTLADQPEPERGFEVNQTREPKHGRRTRTEQLGYRVRMRGPNGEILSSQLFETSTQARLKAHQMERGLRGSNDGRYVEVLPARRTFLNDQTPTAEPVSDVLAQIRDMQSKDALDLRIDPDQRRAVYLTRETLDNLREAGKLDEALRGGIPIRNFDTYGGILLARDEETAQELMQLIEDPKSNIDEVIGYATGAGDGKPGGNNPVVQLLDNDGNVIRERQVRPEEVEPILQKWGPNARVMELELALAIRQNRMQREKAERQVAREQEQFTAYRPDEQVDAIFNENPITRPFAGEAVEAAQQGGFEEDIGGRLTDLAVKQREEELKRRRLDKRIPAPEDVKFRGRDVVQAKQKETAKRRQANAVEAEIAALKEQISELEEQIKQRQPDAKNSKADKGRKKSSTQTYAQWLKGQNFPANDRLEKLREQVDKLTKQAADLRMEADAIRSSVGGETNKREELNAAYQELYSKATDAALRLMEARISGSVQDVTDAENEYETLIDELRSFYDVEGGYTKAEAIQLAANRYSPKGTRETLRALARAREERKAAKDKAEEEALEPVRAAREERYRAGVRDERIMSRGDEPREERKVRNIAESQKVSVETAAEKLQRIRKAVQTPEGQRLIENLFMVMSPSVARDLDQLVDHFDASAEIAKLDKLRAAGKLGDRRYEWRKKLAMRRAEVKSDKHRTAVATALLEINQLLRQWLSDYRTALRYATPAGDNETKRRNYLLAQRAGELSDMLGQLKSFHQGDISVADDAARYLAHRIMRMVAIGKRVGVGSEMDIDGFWSAAEKGPMAFRDYLADTVQAREDLPFPTDLTMEKLEQMSIGTLNALYVKAIEHLDGSRESDGQRREMVSALKKALNERVGGLSDKPETIKIEVWDRRQRQYVTVKREISPRKLMAETFRRSYGLRGADSRMSLDQLKELYLKGGTVTVWENGYVELPNAEKKGKRQPKVEKRGSPKTVVIKPISDKLPEPRPLNVFARRVPPDKKRKIIMRAVRNMDRKQYGGKSQSTGLTRTATSGSTRTRAESKYNPGVLLEDTKPRELSPKESVHYEQKKSEATQDLSDALSSASAYLAQLETAKFQRAALAADKKASAEYAEALDKARKAGTETEFVYTSYITARAYFRWMVEYGQSLLNANLKSYAAFDEMNRVTADIRDIITYPAEEFVAKVERLFRAEMNEQVFRTVSLDPLNLKGLSDPKKRAAMTADSHDRVRKHIMFHKRLTEIWPSHPIFLQDVLPVLNKIADSIAVRHRGQYQESSGWPIATFTDDERNRVMAVLEEWKTAKDKPLMERGRIYQAWGVPADTLYDDFYLPLYEMLRNAGFFDPDVALLKQYNRRFSSYEDQGTGPVDVMILNEEGQPVGRRFVSIEAQDPALLAAAEVDRRKQAMRDRELVAMDDDEAAELNVAERERRKKFIASPIGKTAESARKLLRGNEIISQFVNVLEDTNASVRKIELAEQRMLNQLADIGLYRPTARDLGTIGLPDIEPVMARIEKEQADLKKAMEKVKRDEESPIPLTEGKKQQEIERLAGELQASQQALNEIRALRLGNKKSRTMAYRLVGPRLVAGDITKEEARLAATEKLKGFWVKADKAQRLGQMEAKTRGDVLKERAAKAAKEIKRREGMTIEQRKAAEALDRHYGAGELNFDISAMQSDYRKASHAEYEAFIEFRERLNNTGTAPLGELLALISNQLGTDHQLQPIIRRLLTYAGHRRVPVRFSAVLGNRTAGHFTLEGGSPIILLNEDVFTTPGMNPLRAIHILLHEGVHAATVRAMADNPTLVESLDMLRQIARERLGNKHAYATSNVFEFVAEAYTNAEFQIALKNIRVDKSTLWTRFVQWVRNLLGFDARHDNVLEYVISLNEQTFGPAPYNIESSRKVVQIKKKQSGTDDVALNFRDEVLAQYNGVQELIARAKAMADTGKETGSNLLLKALSMRQIAQIYARYFGPGRVNPLTKYMSAFEARNSYSSELLEDADRLSRRWTALEEADQKNKTHHAVELSRLMHDATVQGIHADKADTALYVRFQSLSPAAQQLYKDVRDYYKITQKREVQLMLANALRASKLWPGGDINHEDIDLEGITKGDWLQKKLGIDVKAEMKKLKAQRNELDNKTYRARLLDLENTKEELSLIVRMASIPAIHKGPYFPLMRFGDYAVRAERVIKTEVYATRAERRKAMERWSKEDPTLQFSFPKTNEEGSFPLTIKEVEFRLAETRTEAEAARQDLLKLYEGGKVSSVQLKQSLMNSSSTIESNRALQTLLGRLEGNAAAQAAIREFYIKSLSDRSFRKREAHRKNVRGADPTEQHRTFGAYSKAASYYTAQLRYGHVMADAKAEMREVVKNHNDEQSISAVRLGQIVREIETRDQQAAQLTDTPAFVRTAVETGQLWLLLSPSYWMINATQPYLVTIPWLAARTNLPTAIAEIAKAQKLILDPLITQGIESWGGLKALKSRLAAEKAFSVLENVTGSIESRMRAQGQDPKPILDMLTALKRESIIDLSFVAELRDIAEGQEQGAWNRVMDASRVLAHLTEVNNRITTAIAAFNMAKNKGLDNDSATAFAKQAVAETQFDYSAANKPRLFSANDAWWKPVVFQFMQYVQHMYVMFIRHFAMWMNNPFAKHGSAAVGRRVVLGLLATHVAAGGLLGATPQLAKWAIGLIMALLGVGDDEDRTFKNWASGELYDRTMADAIAWLVGNGKVGESIRAGLPRLAGVDLSQRVAFLQSHFVDLNTASKETLYGSLVTSFGGPMFGIFGNAFDAIELMAEGDADKAAEKLLPKLGRDAVRAWRYSNEGMVDHTGKTIINADQMSPWELFLTSMGFAPSQVAEVYARNSRAKEAQAFVSRRKAEIMAAYRKSRSTGEINSVMADLREFNAKFPQDRITISQLLRGIRDMQRAEMNIRMFGVDAGRRSNEYADDTYNVE